MVMRVDDRELRLQGSFFGQRKSLLIRGSGVRILGDGIVWQGGLRCRHERYRTFQKTTTPNGSLLRFHHIGVLL